MGSSCRGRGRGRRADDRDRINAGTFRRTALDARCAPGRENRRHRKIPRRAEVPARRVIRFASLSLGERVSREARRVRGFSACTTQELHAAQAEQPLTRSAFGGHPLPHGEGIRGEFGNQKSSAGRAWIWRSEFRLVAADLAKGPVGYDLVGLVVLLLIQDLKPSIRTAARPCCKSKVLNRTDP